MVIPNEVLYCLCNKHQWFTCGTIRQYDKLFEANRLGMDFNGLATIIWVCSDENWSRSEILKELENAEKEW